MSNSIQRLANNGDDETESYKTIPYNTAYNHLA